MFSVFEDAAGQAIQRGQDSRAIAVTGAIDIAPMKSSEMGRTETTSGDSQASEPSSGLFQYFMRKVCLGRASTDLLVFCFRRGLFNEQSCTQLGC